MEKYRTNQSWWGSLQDNFFYFIVTIIIVVGTGYFNFRIRMSDFQQKAKTNQQKLGGINEEIERMQRRRERLRIQMTRINSKINALLRKQGLNPSDFNNRLEYGSPDSNQ